MKKWFYLWNLMPHRSSGSGIMSDSGSGILNGIVAVVVVSSWVVSVYFRFFLGKLMCSTFFVFFSHDARHWARCSLLVTVVYVESCLSGTVYILSATIMAIGTAIIWLPAFFGK